MMTAFRCLQVFRSMVATPQGEGPAAWGAQAPQAPPAQMLRELTGALEALTAVHPVVLVLEDLHWGDQATLAWVAFMVRRCPPARLLVLATARAHAPLDVPLVDLWRQAAGPLLRLGPLAAPAVTAYLTQ